MCNFWFYEVWGVWRNVSVVLHFSYLLPRIENALIFNTYRMYILKLRLSTDSDPCILTSDWVFKAIVRWSKAFRTESIAHQRTLTHVAYHILYYAHYCILPFMVKGREIYKIYWRCLIFLCECINWIFHLLYGNCFTSEPFERPVKKSLYVL